MTNEEINDLMICSFRYSLGRMTYIVDSIARILIAHKSELTQDSIFIICRDIRRAIDRNECGMQIDKETWIEVLEELIE